MNNDLKPGKDYVWVGGGVLIFNENGEALLMRRGKRSKNEAGWWSKPGGTIDYGETAVGAMEREIKEEVDIEIEIWGLLPHTDHLIEGEDQHWLSINFLADLKSGAPKIMEPEKCEEIGWFRLDQLPEKLTKTTREPIKYYLEGKYISFR